jgi:hypothetical protein
MDLLACIELIEKVTYICPPPSTSLNGELWQQRSRFASKPVASPWMILFVIILFTFI